MLRGFLEQGDSVKYMTLNAAKFGVGSERPRFALYVVRRGLPLPASPIPTHYSPRRERENEEVKGLLPFVTVRDAIGDLQWRNPRVKIQRTDQLGIHCDVPKDGGQPQPTDYALSLGAQTSGSVTHHRTGKPANPTWDRKRAIGSYDEPLGTILTVPNGNWPCCHPLYENEIMSPRELARISSFPDNHRFAGPPSKQYKQIGNAVPPLLAKVIALQIRKCLEESYPHMRFAPIRESHRNIADLKTLEQAALAGVSVQGVPHDAAREGRIGRFLSRPLGEVDGTSEDERPSKKTRIGVD
ncbi:S-adenosyl-L-methionine-dependent methyltransferase [Stereum hirsutum FP-91666 SS1]|uniref:S-adenosyl-L-methionine-dependent methyltransferase n=1 Tax=Stereum hirsutum (strain FP-91666) TaxID=721885 RepID=UPI0004449872|nr:S-adenosyl-L-methionine-dependent methyltransferase [Stereum hirsutum FP-91666 SS1]EIM82520.1 S-adenosyl-L-methionine-dependent methyltransferase [Stereum hirsutum FP-91666 SS1]